MDIRFWLLRSIAEVLKCTFDGAIRERSCPKCQTMFDLIIKYAQILTAKEDITFSPLYVSKNSVQSMRCIWDEHYLVMFSPNKVSNFVSVG